MRRQLAATAPAISLFPFLAVLLCTMGALIVVLVVLNRQSRLQAAAVSAAEAAGVRQGADQAEADAQMRRDELAWQLEHLRSSRERTQDDLNSARLKLSGVEEHRRRLESRLAELVRAEKQLDSLASDDAQRQARELAQLTAAIQSAQQELEQIRQRAAEQPPAYSVVLYDGPNRTRRRPIYIECAGDRVILQPEGIALRPSDFEGPMGPGNPLASAMRAARDHIASKSPDSESPGAEPYPLFLVRPDGIEAYYAARAAMSSWGADFGYQTVDQDWQLQYPTVDPQLAEVEQQAVDESRQRLRWLAQLNGGHFGGGGGRIGDGDKASYRVSPMGGLVREGGPSLRDAGPSLHDRRSARPRFGESSLVADNPGGGMSDEPSAPVGNRSGQAASHGVEKLADASTPVRAAIGQAGRSTTSGAAENRRGQPAERRYGDLNDRRVTEEESSAAFDAQGSASADRETGETQVNMQVNSKAKQRPRSLAETRGVNWGLSPAARSSNPITRPIHILCEGDKLSIRAEQRVEPATEIPLHLQTEDSVDRLVATVQQRIEEWGIAGRGLYWRPQLVLEVGHSGEGRYADLEALLADSGFDVKRK